MTGMENFTELEDAISKHIEIHGDDKVKGLFLSLGIHLLDLY